MIDSEKYQPARQNMKFVTRSLRSLATKLHILARHADIFGINHHSHPDNIKNKHGYIYIFIFAGKIT
jgi:hypothetical protein